MPSQLTEKRWRVQVVKGSESMLIRGAGRIPRMLNGMIQQRRPMKINTTAGGIFSAICVLAVSSRIAHPQVMKVTPSLVQVHMVITDQSFTDNGEVPVFGAQNVTVKQGENAIKVDQVIPARGDNAGLQLLLLIDDTLDLSFGSNLNDIRDFVNVQPASTGVAIAYMSNASFRITQNFTDDHVLAAKGARLPLGMLSAMDSPYLSLINLVKSWPQQKVRREILMISDGTDLLRGRSPAPTYPTLVHRRGSMPPQHTTMAGMSPDKDSASAICQRYGVIVHSICATVAGRRGPNAWEAQMGQSGIAKIADETGGEYLCLGISNAISFKPYLDRLQNIFNDRYYIEFQAMPRKKDGLQRVDISTSVPDADIASAENVWVAMKSAGI